MGRVDFLSAMNLIQTPERLVQHRPHTCYSTLRQAQQGIRDLFGTPAPFFTQVRERIEFRRYVRFAIEVAVTRSDRRKDVAHNEAPAKTK